MGQLTESELVEKPTTDWLVKLGYCYCYGGDLSPENNERISYQAVILKQRFKEAIKRLNPWLDDEGCRQVYRKITELEHPDLVMKSKLFYEMLVNGVKLTLREGNRETTRLVWLVDFNNPQNNDFLVANQFQVECLYTPGEHRRPDLVVFINGIPVAIFELKSFNAEETARDAFNELQAKKTAIPQLYVYAQILAVSDGVETKYGSISSDWSYFTVWEGINSDDDLNISEIDEYGHCRYFSRTTGEELSSLKVLLTGLFTPEHLLEFIRDFVIYEKNGTVYEKKIAFYHQFYAVRRAVAKTVECVTTGRTPEERRIGVIWHTQGSGKSLTMLYYARKVLKQPELNNPLLVFITDRNELDEQLYSVFSDLILARRAESIRNLQNALRTAGGGIIFATIQKFGSRKETDFPFLTDRRNLIVVADEAHRSQYRKLAQNIRRAVPNACFLGFTATPIELEDRDTYIVFGEPLSVYTMDKGIRHNVIVPIYYEPRLAELHLTNEFINEEFEEISERVAADPETKESLKRKFARLERLMLAEDRLNKIAADIVSHFASRRQGLKGKALVVTISRQVAVRLYDKIRNLKPEWEVAVVMSGNPAQDPPEFHPHLRRKPELDEIALRFKNPDSPLEMVIVVDMWLTGFNAPCLHTMYFDKPMKGHSLIQAIARVNRVFKDKPGGLIVDYIGIADYLRTSLGLYATVSDRQILTNISEIIALIREKYDVVMALFAGIDFRNWRELTQEQIHNLTMAAYERVARDEETQKRFLKNFTALKKLYALACPHPETIRISTDLQFLEMVKKMLVRYSVREIRAVMRDLEHEINQLISQSIAAQEPVDVMQLLGKDKPNISVLDEQFLARFRQMEFKNYAAEVLIRILRDQITARLRSNPARYSSLLQLLKELIKKYNVQLITTTAVIDELINIAREFRTKIEEGRQLGLSEEELAFYDLLMLDQDIFAENADIRKIAREIAGEIGPYVRIAEWHKREQIRSKIRAALKSKLPKYLEDIEWERIEKIAQRVVEQLEQMHPVTT